MSDADAETACEIAWLDPDFDHIPWSPRSEALLLLDGLKNGLEELAYHAQVGDSCIGSILDAMLENIQRLKELHARNEGVELP